MSLYILDTDSLSLFARGHSPIVERVLSTPPYSLAVTVITVEEHVSGWYDVLRKATTDERLALGYASLSQTVELLKSFRVLPFTRDAIARYRILSQQKLNVRRMDLRIAATVLEFEGTLITRNMVDFQRIPEIGRAHV